MITMSFLATVGAVVVGLLSTVVLLTGTLLGWTWVNGRLKHPAVEPTLPLALLLVVGLNGWLLNATTGDAGVFGLLLGIAACGAYIHYHYKRRKPQSQWERFTTWAMRK